MKIKLELEIVSNYYLHLTGKYIYSRLMALEKVDLIKSEIFCFCHRRARARNERTEMILFQFRWKFVFLLFVVFRMRDANKTK